MRFVREILSTDPAAWIARKAITLQKREYQNYAVSRTYSPALVLRATAIDATEKNATEMR